MWTKRVFLLMISAICLMTACNTGGRRSGTVTNETVPGDNAVSIGLATVENIAIRILESFPVQIHVIAKGVVRDGCATISEITQVRQGTSFQITILTTRPADGICLQTQMTAFEETIPLDVYNLPAGTYTVDVNGMHEKFILDVYNGV